MAIRSIASLSLTFGLVSIPVKVCLATESSAAIKFKLMAAGGGRLRQQYVADAPPVRFDSGTPDEPERDAPPELERTPPERDDVVSPLRASTSRPFAAAADSEPRDEPQVIERAEMVKGY